MGDDGYYLAMPGYHSAFDAGESRFDWTALESRPTEMPNPSIEAMIADARQHLRRRSPCVAGDGGPRRAVVHSPRESGGDDVDNLAGCVCPGAACEARVRRAAARAVARPGGRL